MLEADLHSTLLSADQPDDPGHAQLAQHAVRSHHRDPPRVARAGGLFRRAACGPWPGYKERPGMDGTESQVYIRQPSGMIARSYNKYICLVILQNSDVERSKDHFHT